MIMVMLMVVLLTFRLPPYLSSARFGCEPKAMGALVVAPRAERNEEVTLLITRTEQKLCAGAIQLFGA